MKNANYPSALAGDPIKMLVLDVDGVLTSNQIQLDEKGFESKVFFVPDGTGLKLVMHAGVQVAWISGRASQAVHQRAKELQICDCLTGVKNKIAVLKEILSHHNIDAKDTLYVGDDFIDIPPMKVVGRPVAVSNAHPLVKQVATAITECKGGEGAVREVCEWILHINENWHDATESYMQ